MKKTRPLLGNILQKIAPQIGATVTIEPEWGIVGQITFSNGKKRYFRYSSIDINSLGASEIAKDKGFAKFFMACMGYSVVTGDTFFSDDWATTIHSSKDIHSAYQYAETLGFPVIVKPNSGSQGDGIALVHDREAFYHAMSHIFKRDRVAIVERPVTGKDYRIVVLDGRIISAYERIPLNVIGDGVSSIHDLLRKKQEYFIASSRDTRLHVDDPRITEKLGRQNRSLDFVPKNGERVFLLDNANLSCGGDAIDVSEKMHPFFRDLAIRLTKDMGLRLCGVDIMIHDDISRKSPAHWIIEINAAPGLDHYAQTGEAQEKTVEAMYLEVLKSMAM